MADNYDELLKYLEAFVVLWKSFFLKNYLFQFSYIIFFIMFFIIRAEKDAYKNAQMKD
jgi:hypothetical protein